MRPDPGSPAAGGDAAKRVFDRQVVEDVRVVAFKPLGDLAMIRMLRIGEGLELIVEAGNATAILRRRDMFAADIAWIRYARFAGSNLINDEAMLPPVAEVVQVLDDRLVGSEHLAKTHLARICWRVWVPIVATGQAVASLTDGELPEVIIEPTPGDLNDVMPPD